MYIWFCCTGHCFSKTIHHTFQLSNMKWNTLLSHCMHNIVLHQVVEQLPNFIIYKILLYLLIWYFIIIKVICYQFLTVAMCISTNNAPKILASNPGALLFQTNMEININKILYQMHQLSNILKFVLFQFLNLVLIYSNKWFTKDCKWFLVIFNIL